jgi:hypothetical protein
MSAVLLAAATVPSEHRNEFLQAVANELMNCAELGPGIIYRAVKTVQSRFFIPPERVGVVGVGKQRLRHEQA